MLEFRKRWQISLQRFYSWGYETHRIKFFEKYVYNELSAKPKRILDLGCGRGLFSEYLSDRFPGAEIVGVDEAHFNDYWEDISRRRPNVRFSEQHVKDLAEWFSGQQPFDFTIMLWVLHHSSLASTERMLKLLGPNGRAGDLVICEDSWLPDKKPAANEFGFSEKWVDGSRGEGFEAAAHAILDFVAVQVLAGYSNVAMPRNYLRGDKWAEIIERQTGRAVTANYIGFPKGRDIAVPQLLLKAPSNARKRKVLAADY